MFSSHSLLKFLRKMHLYIGIFTAPALVFFAFTGALQSVNLHETTQGSSYQPPAWLKSMAQLHKKQTTEVPVRRARPGGDGPGGGRPGSPSSSTPGGQQGGSANPAPPPKGHWPMKIFFVVVSLGLLISTLTGVYMAYRYARKPWLVTGWLAAGTVLPLLLLPF